MATQISPRAEVSPKAVVGANVSIGPFTIVEAGAVIGDGCSIGGNALIASGARLGRDCKVHHGAVIGHVPQDLKYANEPTTCEIGDRTTVREFATIHRGTGDGGRTVIGIDCFLMAYIHIAHDCILGDRVIIASGAMMAGHTEIGHVVTIGGLTAIHQFCRIGDHAMIGGGLRMNKDVPPYILAGGEPLSFEGLNSIGLRRRGFERGTLDALDRVYELIYRSNLNVSQARTKIEAEPALMTLPEVRNVVEFIRNSQRGIVPAPRLHHR
jgi:UDP-N-acetylglucosamine acyltransferase